MLAIGIDLGTTYSCVGILQGDEVEIIPNNIGKSTTPSHVAFEEDGTPVVGDAAKRRSDIKPENGIFDVKRLIGRKFTDPIVQKDIKYWPFKVIDGGQDNPMINVVGLKLLPEQISARILSSLKSQAEEYLQGNVTDAVITVPAYFNDGQRQATRDAGQIAGLNVLRIINEPTAAAIAYNFQKQSSELKTILVFDLGGGTFDISILKMKNRDIDVLGVGGDTHLGGEDFDNVLLEHCVKEFKRSSGIDLKGGTNSWTTEEKVKTNRVLRRLKIECEAQKIHLSASKEVTINIDAAHGTKDLSVKISREIFEDLNKEMFDKCVQVMEKTLDDAKLNKSKIDDVILVGGSSKIPAIISRIEKFFEGKKPLQTIRGDEAVAYGAAILASSISSQDQPKTGSLPPMEYKITDVCPLPVGIKIKVEKGDTKDFSCIIDKNTALPYKKMRPYVTAEANQASVHIEIFQGEDESVSKNYRLGEFEITGMPTTSPAGEPLEVTMEINAEGILNVTAICVRNKASNKLSIKAEKWRLTAQQILDMKKQELDFQNRMDD